MDETSEPPSSSKRPAQGDAGSSKRTKIEMDTAKPDEGPTSELNPEGKNSQKQQKNTKGKGGKDKDKGRGKSRRRGTRQEGPTGEADSTPKALRLPKRQCALLIGFCGTGCNGMQIQPNVRTIEGVLFEALVKAGAVSQDNADDPVKVNLGRAARTDAGVHAAGNLVSIKMITEVPSVSDMRARINELLPPEIRLWSFVRVQNAFSARTFCDSRKYTYVFPSYALLPPKPGSGLHKTYHKQPLDTPETAIHPFWSSFPTESTSENSKEDDLRKKRQWRIDIEQVELLRAIARKFEGSHNFHNFTVGRDFSDRSTQRFMKSIEISDPVIHGETEWISVMWHGQSFMLHQRKMMSAMILVCRTGTPSQIIDELYGPRTVFVPKMPSLGLLLEYPIFDGYNKKVASINDTHAPSDPDYRPPIDFEAHREEIDKFKQQYIYKRIREIEEQDAVFDAWIRHIDSYSGNDLSYLNPKAIIPPGAVFKKGEKRENPFREKRRFDSTGKRSEVKDEEVEELEEEGKLDKSKLDDMEG